MFCPSVSGGGILREPEILPTMSVRVPQHGDYVSTLERKILQNVEDVMRGNLTLSVSAGTSTDTPLTPERTDTKHDLLRKLLVSVTGLMRGTLTLSTS